MLNRVVVRCKHTLTSHLSNIQKMKDVYPTLRVFNHIDSLTKTLTDAQKDMAKIQTQLEIIKNKENKYIGYDDIVQCYDLQYHFKEIVYIIMTLSNNDIKILMKELQYMIELQNKGDWVNRRFKLKSSLKSMLTTDNLYEFQKWMLLNPSGINTILYIFKDYTNTTRKQFIIDSYSTKLEKVQSDVSSITDNLCTNVSFAFEDMMLETQLMTKKLSLSELASRYKEMEDFSFLRNSYDRRGLESLAKSLMIDTTGTKWIKENWNDQQNWTRSTMRYILIHGWHKYVQYSFIDRGIGWNTMSITDAEYFDHPECIHHVRNCTNKECNHMLSKL